MNKQKELFDKIATRLEDELIFEPLDENLVQKASMLMNEELHKGAEDPDYLDFDYVMDPERFSLTIKPQNEAAFHLMANAGIKFIRIGGVSSATED